MHHDLTSPYTFHQVTLTPSTYKESRTYRESGGTAPHIFNLGSTCRLVVIFTLRPLHDWGKRSRYAFNRELGGLHSQFGGFGLRNNSLFLSRIEPPLFLGDGCHYQHFYKQNWYTTVRESRKTLGEKTRIRGILCFTDSASWYNSR